MSLPECPIIKRLSVKNFWNCFRTNEVTTSGKRIDKTKWGSWQLVLTATYRFNKTIAAATIKLIVTVAIVVYKGLKPVVYRMLTKICDNKNHYL